MKKVLLPALMVVAMMALISCGDVGTMAPTGSALCENEIVDYLYKGSIYDTNTDALKQIMGNWSASPETYGVIGAYLPSAPNEDSLYHKIADSTYPVWAGTSVVMQYGIFGSLGEFTGDNVATRMASLLQALGTNQVYVTNRSAKSIVDAINSTIGAYYPGTDGYTGILGALSDPAYGYGVMASLGSGFSYQTTIKGLIEDTTGPPGTGTPSVLPGLIGAIDNSGDSASLAAAILEVYAKLDAKVGNQTIPVRAEGQGLCQWIDSFAPNP